LSSALGYNYSKNYERGYYMDMYTAVKNRILQLLGEKRMSIHRLAMESAVAPSSIKNILYGKSQNPGIVTLKMLCDGFGITIVEFFDTEEFRNLEQEIK
jgi:transcriptional regulator with XRE-family HTH domain